MGSSEFTIPTGDLDSGGTEYVFPVRAAWMRGTLEQHEATAAGPDGSLEVRASRSGHDVIVHGTLAASLTVPCARCLEAVPFAVREPVIVLFSPRAALALRDSDKDREMGADDADTLPYDGETVVLDDWVRDELILQTPSFPLCSEDCPGMRPSPEKDERGGAADRDVDPRLRPLMRILDPKE